MDNKCILWVICSLTCYLKGKVLSNKKAETTIDTLEATWIYDVNITSVGFWLDKGREFLSMKIYYLTPKLGVSIKLTFAYSP